MSASSIAECEASLYSALTYIDKYSNYILRDTYFIFCNYSEGWVKSNPLDTLLIKPETRSIKSPYIQNLVSTLVLYI